MKKEHEKSEWRKKNIWRAVAAVVLFAVIIFTAYAIESNIDSTAKLGALAPQNYIRHLSWRRGALTDPNAIVSWMTFDYLNAVFKLPTDYLKNALNITDARYPRLTISHLSDDKRTNSTLVLTAVKAAVQSFLSTQNNATK